MPIQSEEMQIIDYVYEHLGEFVLIDVGAAEGEFTDAVKERCGFAAAVLFEPRSSAARILQERYQNDAVRVHNVALGDYIELMPLTLGDDRQQSHLRGVYVGEQFEQVQVETLDNLYRFNGDGPPIFLKIDTEGYEIPTLIGAKENLKYGRIEAIQFEYGGTWPSTRHFYLKDAFDLLTNYDIYEPRNGEMCLVTSAEDDYKYRNYLAMRRA